MKNLKRKEMSLCVIIPTYNRTKIINKTLKFLEKQTIRPNKVIIVDDGSSPQEIKKLKQFIRKVDLPILLRMNFPQKGPAAARNKGILLSKEDIILFLNDDTVPLGKNFLKNHLEMCGNYQNCSVMGPFGGRRRSNKDLLSGKWIKKLGIEFFYPYKKGQILSYGLYCTANVCIPRHFLKNCLFDENFPYPAHEDTDFGYRLYLKGVQLRYNPDSQVFHFHDYTPEMVLSRQDKIGYSVGYLLELHPEISDIFKPKLPEYLSRLVQLILRTPLSVLLTKDFSLFLNGLVSKYNSFYRYQKKVTL